MYLKMYIRKCLHGSFKAFNLVMIIRSVIISVYTIMFFSFLYTSKQTVILIIYSLGYIIFRLKIRDWKRFFNKLKIKSSNIKIIILA